MNYDPQKDQGPCNSQVLKGVKIPEKEQLCLE